MAQTSSSRGWRRILRPGSTYAGVAQLRRRTADSRARLSLGERHLQERGAGGMARAAVAQVEASVRGHT